MASCEQTEGKNKAIFTRSRLCDFSPHLTSIKWNFHIQNLPFVTYFFPAHPPHEPGSPFYRWSKMDLHSQMRPLSEILGGRHFIDIVHPLFCWVFPFYRGCSPPQNHFNTIKWGPTCCTLNSQGDIPDISYSALFPSPLLFCRVFAQDTSSIDPHQ
jgi:hypothetical protein